MSNIREFALWKELQNRSFPLSFDFELTARCNNDCRHCYINRSANDRECQQRELSLAEIERLADEAAEIGVVWCLLTGGEPLLRDDFPEIYMALRQRGLLVSVNTNACLLTDDHVSLFRANPPRDLEVSVYGVTEDTYERVTRRKGSFRAFLRGLERLENGGIRARLKAMALRSNVHELEEIARFCRQRTKDYYRFDPSLHLRYDGDERRNSQIRAERLVPDDVVRIEASDRERATALRNICDLIVSTPQTDQPDDTLFRCGAGIYSFAVGPEGDFRLCSTLVRPDTTYNWRDGNLREAWQEHVPRVRNLRACTSQFSRRCGSCACVNLCFWCPAHAYLETGSLEAHVESFCSMAYARAAAIGAELGKHR